MHRCLYALTESLFKISCAALAVMLLSYLVEVSMRYFLNAPTRWASDVVSYAMLTTIAFALPAVTRDGGHVAITSLIDAMSPEFRSRANRLLAWICALVCMGAGMVLCTQAVAQWQDGIETVATLSIPKFWLSGAVGAGLIVSALQFLLPAKSRDFTLLPTDPA